MERRIRIPVVTPAGGGAPIRHAGARAEQLPRRIPIRIRRAASHGKGAHE